jgi:hypothetical protein
MTHAETETCIVNAMAAQDEAIWLASPPSPPVDLVALFDELSAMLGGNRA